MILYCIRHMDEVVYIGITNNLKRRQSQHRTALKNKTPRLIYKYLLMHNVSPDDLVLELLDEGLEQEIKMKECFLILYHYFNGYPLKQALPKRISYY